MTRSTPKSNCFAQRRCCRRGRADTLMKSLRSPGALAHLVAAAALLLGLAAESAGAQRVRRSSSQGRARTDTTFTFDKTGSITVTAPNGDIVINGTSGNQLHIRGGS